MCLPHWQEEPGGDLHVGGCFLLSGGCGAQCPWCRPRPGSRGRRPFSTRRVVGHRAFRPGACGLPARLLRGLSWGRTVSSEEAVGRLGLVGPVCVGPRVLCAALDPEAFALFCPAPLTCVCPSVSAPTSSGPSCRGVGSSSRACALCCLPPSRRHRNSKYVQVLRAV